MKPTSANTVTEVEKLPAELARPELYTPAHGRGKLLRGGLPGHAGGSGRPRSEVVALIRDKTLKVAVPRLAYLTQHAKDEALQLEAALALTKLAVERGPVHNGAKRSKRTCTSTSSAYSSRAILRLRATRSAYESTTGPDRRTNGCPLCGQPYNESLPVRQLPASVEGRAPAPMYQLTWHSVCLRAARKAAGDRLN